MAWITGVGMTAFGRHEGSSTIGLMSQAATEALEDAGLERRDIDGLVCGYSTTMPHLMLSTLFAEHYHAPLNDAIYGAWDRTVARMSAAGPS